MNKPRKILYRDIFILKLRNCGDSFCRNKTHPPAASHPCPRFHSKDWGPFPGKIYHGFNHGLLYMLQRFESISGMNAAGSYFNRRIIKHAETDFSPAARDHTFGIFASRRIETPGTIEYDTVFKKHRSETRSCAAYWPAWLKAKAFTFFTGPKMIQDIQLVWRRGREKSPPPDNAGFTRQAKCGFSSCSLLKGVLCRLSSTSLTSPMVFAASRIWFLNKGCSRL